MKKKQKQESFCGTNPFKFLVLYRRARLVEINKEEENTKLGEKYYVDHYHYLVCLVAAWLFRRKY
jgi:hypothetical protein